MKRADIIDLLTALKTLDPRGYVTIDNTMISVWESVLNRDPAITSPDAMRTAYDLVATPEAVFPKPGDFRAMVAERVSNLPSVGEARKQVERALKENYPGMPPLYTPDLPVLQALRQIGGAAMFRNATTEYATNALWKAFDEAYRAIRDRQVTPRDTGPALAGGSVTALKGGAS